MLHQVGAQQSCQLNLHMLAARYHSQPRTRMNACLARVSPNYCRVPTTCNTSECTWDTKTNTRVYPGTGGRACATARPALPRNPRKTTEANQCFAQPEAHRSLAVYVPSSNTLSVVFCPSSAAQTVSTSATSHHASPCMSDMHYGYGP
jgi:hypothetical protein